MPDQASMPLPIKVEDIPYRWVRDELRFARTLEHGARSRQVRLVQECLSLEGINLRIDGIYGGGTTAAVERFQGLRGLPTTGKVDIDTHYALVRPFLRALSPIDPAGQSPGELCVAYATQHLAEHPREIGGQNKGPWVRLYCQGMETLWCAGFVCFVLNQAADRLGLQAPLETTLSCDRLAEGGQASGGFLSEQELGDNPSMRRAITPGSIFLNRRTPGDWTHTGVVVNAAESLPLSDSDFFDTIEGNTNDDGHREGYEVCARIRGFANKDFILIS